MRTRLSKAYARLALNAGEQCGIQPPASLVAEQIAPVLEAISQDGDARALRDAAWLDYEQLLLDVTWQVKRLRLWLHDRGIDVGLASVQRDRDAARAHLRVLELAAGKAKAVFAALEGISGGKMRAGIGQLIMQHLLSFLTSYDADRLQDLAPADVVRLFGKAAEVGKLLVEADVAEVRLDDMQRQFDRAVQERSSKRPGGQITADELAEIRKLVFGGHA